MIPLMTGDTIGTSVVWRWNRARMRFEANHEGHEIRIDFHKVGGRWSRALPDGTPTPGAGSSYWTSEIDCDRSRVKHPSADDAKRAAVAEFKRRFS